MVVLISSTPGSAQNNTPKETILLTNGTMYSGVVQEIQDGDSMKFITIDGQDITVNIDDVLQLRNQEGLFSDSIRQRLVSLKIEPNKTLPRFYHVRQKGYFIQWHFCFDYVQFGFHVINGYKFGRFGYLGIGFGIDNLVKPTSFWPEGRREESHRISGGYVPLFLHYSADLLKRRTTPFYSVELGYAFGIGDALAQELSGNYPSAPDPHGLYASSVVGVRFNTSRRFHTNLGLRLNLKTRNLIFRELDYNSESGLYGVEYNERTATGFFIGITLIQGL